MDDFPLSTAFLEQFRLRARQRTRAGQVGAHLRRRQGQSLEFRDFTPYTPGDDVRYIDWRVSLRVGQRGDLLVRRFGAEEQLTLAVSVDNRPRMHLPEHAPKIVMAGWLARALGEVALRRGDRVVLHRLFGAGPPGVVELRQRRTLHAA